MFYSMRAIITRKFLFSIEMHASKLFVLSKQNQYINKLLSFGNIEQNYQASVWQICITYYNILLLLLFI